MDIRGYRKQDVAAMVRIWNRVVEDGEAFPQEELLTEETGREFFAAQTYCGVADADGDVVGMYILHPNNVGRCGHIANASYAVDAMLRGEHIGEKLVTDCLAQAGKHGYIHARHLYERLGFTQVGIIPEGFRMKDGSYQNIVIYYHMV